MLFHFFFHGLSLMSLKMFKENIINAKILFFQYKYVHSGLTHLIVQGWMQCGKASVFIFSILEVSFL